MSSFSYLQHYGVHFTYFVQKIKCTQLQNCSNILCAIYNMEVSFYINVQLNFHIPFYINFSLRRLNSESRLARLRSQTHKSHKKDLTELLGESFNLRSHKSKLIPVSIVEVAQTITFNPGSDPLQLAWLIDGIRQVWGGCIGEYCLHSSELRCNTSLLRCFAPELSQYCTLIPQNEECIHRNILPRPTVFHQYRTHYIMVSNCQKNQALEQNPGCFDVKIEIYIGKLISLLIEYGRSGEDVSVNTVFIQRN